MNARHAARITTTLPLLLLVACAQPAKSPPHEPHPAGQRAEAAHAPSHDNAPHWSYDGEAGPPRWAALSTDWAPCGNGMHQSPIDIDATRQSELSDGGESLQPITLTIVHADHAADEINNGHTIQVNEAGADTLTIGNEEFPLAQYHFHAPSEHTVQGKSYPMEMHLVHRSTSGALAVIGVFIEEGAHNAAFDPVWTNLPATPGAESHLDHIQVDIDALLPTIRTAWRYDGSLTTPPCSEGVNWIVMTEPIQMDAGQIEAFRKIIPANNRPVQPLNQRAIVNDVVAQTP